MELLRDIFSMPLFPHLYMIPMTFVAGIMVGMQIRSSDREEELLPPKPNVDE